jgi:hypothetical protein
LPPVLHQITLNTGEIRHRDRAVIPVDVLPGALEAIDRMVHKNTCIPMNFDGESWLVAGHAEDRTLTITLWRGTWDKRVLFLSAGTAPDLVSGKALWARLHEHSSDPIPDPPQDVPWIAERFEPIGLLLPQTTIWAIDFSAMIGWAWLVYLAALELPVH